jgi:putative transposase
MPSSIKGDYMAIEQELLDSLLANYNYQKPNDLIGENGLLKQLTKAVLERALQAEMTVHLGHEKHGAISTKGGNARNGKTGKTLKGDFGNMPIVVPRDRDSSFEPVIIPKGKTRFAGFDNNIISLYARGMTTREIQGHLEDIYGVEVSPSLISTVTDAVNDEVKVWQNRSLDAVYPIVYMDVIRVKGRSTGHVLNKAVYLAIGITMDGVKEVLGMWVAETEGAKFWLHVVTELKNRGVQDIFIACVDGLKGFPEAIETVFPQAQVQLCIVHIVRNSLKYVSWKQRKEVAADLKKIYQSSTAEQAEMHLIDFGEKWDKALPSISQSWQKNWERITPFFAYPPEIRKVIYTTNAIESLNMSLRRVTKHRGSFPNDESILKLLYLALNNIAKKWTMPIRDWKAALNRFFILFGDRMPAY